MKWIPIITNENDWIFISFIAILGIIAFIKTYHSFRFKEFLNLLTNNKYIIIFNKKERSNTLFTTLLLIVQWVAMSICIWLIFSFFNINISIYNIHSEYIIFIGIGLFILLKLAIQFFISYSLNINNFLRSYLFIRLSYSNYASFILLLFLFPVCRKEMSRRHFQKRPQFHQPAFPIFLRHGSVLPLLLHKVRELYSSRARR